MWFAASVRIAPSCGHNIDFLTIAPKMIKNCSKASGLAQLYFFTIYFMKQAFHVSTQPYKLISLSHNTMARNPSSQ